MYTFRMIDVATDKVFYEVTGLCESDSITPGVGWTFRGEDGSIRMIRSIVRGDVLITKTVSQSGEVLRKKEITLLVETVGIE